MSEHILEGSAPKDASNVIDIAMARRRPHAEPQFSDEERQAIRDLLEYMRTQRPILEAAASRCTVLRRIVEEGV